MSITKGSGKAYGVLALLSAIAFLVLSACPAIRVESTTAADVEAKAIPAGYAYEPSTADTGAILQAYMWPFSSITSNMATIAKAGYTAVQTSPVQPTKEAGSTWWLLYQPCDFSIGNSQLGSSSQFSTMCATAKNYGVKVIVDAVLNHVADNGSDGVWSSAVASYLKNSSYYHNKGTCTNYSSRWNVTQQNLGNLPDLNTQNSTVQGFLISFLNSCVSAGADGFRFDAAKHIETNIYEDSGQAWAGSFWANVKSAMSGKSLYNYGEVLPNSGDNHQAYTSYYDITAHNYAYTVLNAVNNRNVTGIQNYSAGFDATLSPSQCLVYIENHDSYQEGATSSYSYATRKLANALVLARANITVMVFDRPTDDLWKDTDIVAMNTWRNRCYGLSEYLRFPSSACVAVERGNKGIAFINTGSSSCSVNVASSLPAGTYYSGTSSAATMTVSGGYVRGTIPAGAIVTIYANGSATPSPTATPAPSSGGTATTTIKVTYDVGYGNSMYLRGSVSPLSWTTGLKMTWSTGNVWTYTTTAIPSGASFEFKALINNATWSDGANFTGKGGTTVSVTPTFNGNFYDTMDNLKNWTISGYTGTGKWHIYSYRARAYGCYTQSVMTYKYAMSKVGSKVTLAYKIQYTGLDSGEYLAVDVSKDGGATWKQVASYTGTLSTATNKSVDVTAYKSNNFKVRFRTKMNSRYEYAYVDNVSVSVVK